jgi:UDP-N-acetylmuramyl tripeptide synthase
MAPPRPGCSAREELVSRVINVDDPFGRVLARDPRGRGRLIVTSRGHQSHTRAAGGFRARHARRTIYPRHRARIRFELGSGRAHQRLIGDFNVDNLLTVIAILLDWELTPEQVSHTLARVHAAPGRMETFGGDPRAARGSRLLRTRRRAAQGA